MTTEQLHNQAAAAEATGELDAATRSLHRALRLSFGVLRLAMLVFVVLFAVSGVFSVNEGEVAVRLRFGRVAAYDGESILEPGGPYFAWPAPIDEVVRVSTTVERLELDRSFWFEMGSGDALKPLDEIRPRAGGLAPGRDGSLLTGDQNIVHARWSVSYRVRTADAAFYLANVGGREHADRLVRYAAEAAIVRIVAQTPVDEFVRGLVQDGAIERNLQARLTQLETGIEVVEVQLRQPTPPLSVRPAFLEVSQAESEKAERIQTAQREWARIHNEVAGAGHAVLMFAIEQYEDARRRNDVARVAVAEEVLTRLLEGQSGAEALREWIATESEAGRSARLGELATEARVSGRVSEIINEAKTLRTETVARARADWERFKRLLPIYTENPVLTRELLVRAAMQEIFSGDVELFVLPENDGKTLELDIDRNPELRKMRDREAHRRRREATRTDVRTGEQK